MPWLPNPLIGCWVGYHPCQANLLLLGVKLACSLVTTLTELPWLHYETTLKIHHIMQSPLQCVDHKRLTVQFMQTPPPRYSPYTSRLRRAAATVSL